MVFLDIMQYGAYPVFVVDGTPSPLKSQTRISRFYRSSGIDTTCSLQEGVSVERNKQFCEWVSECMVRFEPLMLPFGSHSIIIFLFNTFLCLYM